MVKSLFHEGEVTVQQRFGEEELAARNSRIIKDHIPPNAPHAKSPGTYGRM